MTDSTTPIPTRDRADARDEEQPVEQRIAQREGQDQVQEQGRQQEQLHRRAVQHETEERPAVIEDHHLVDHRELEVRVGIVDGNPRILGEQHDEQGDGDEEERRRRRGRAAERVIGAWNIGVRLSEPEKRTSTTNAMNSAASARQANETSRAAPMPSKAEPVSSAAAVVKKRPRAIR